MDGNATLTTLKSSWSTNCAAHTTMSATFSDRDGGVPTVDDIGDSFDIFTPSK
jgi:hypothetical protein